jgi:hypothetical protein
VVGHPGGVCVVWKQVGKQSDKKRLFDGKLANSEMKYWLFMDKKGGQVQKAKKMA